ncbi:hypothetical protein [Tellurirhabdus rosea]|uniref:hypothetical protein n=1 Tax=Tellurirhabdus rosea TaxID=2674997 RepID=UPI002250CF75|nr:hypothetical protein [Tellurirhabdus rosea]
MHNIDRTLQEFGTGGQEMAAEYAPQPNNEASFEQEFGYEAETDPAQQELEAAYELLEIATEQELNQFLSGLLSSVAGVARNAASSFVQSPTGQALGRHLMDFGKQTLPKLASQYGGQALGAVGNRVGQAVGGKIGGAAGQALASGLQRGGTWLGQKAGGYVGQKAGDFVAGQAKRIFNLELEALSPENQEFEVARAYLRYANDLARRTFRTYRRYPRWSPRQISRRVLPATARLYAPGLFYQPQPVGGWHPADDEPEPTGQSGTWQRRGGTIVLFGV